MVDLLVCLIIAFTPWISCRTCDSFTNGVACAQGVNPDESKISVSDRSVFLVVIKAEDAKEHWPRLLKEKGKVTNITVSICSLLHQDISIPERSVLAYMCIHVHTCASPNVCSQVDWNKWVDEDEEEEGGKKDDFDLSDLQNFQNFGGGAFGGGLGGGLSGIGNVEAVEDDGDDSDDDDDMPPLEEEKK